MEKYTVIERELNVPEYEYEEEFNTLQEAQDRMAQMYHNIAVDEEGWVEEARIDERSAYAVLTDGNVISWDIE